MMFEKFLGPWQEEWGKIQIRRDRGLFGLGVRFQKYSVGTRVGDPRQRFTYTLSFDVVVWQIDFMYFRRVAP